MAKSKYKISNWKQYNQALVQRGSLTVWMDEQAIQQWHCQSHRGRRGRGFHYSESAIETALMLKGVFKLPLRALEYFLSAFASGDSNVSHQAAHRAEAKPAELQRPSGRNLGWREDHVQGHRTRYACSAGRQLSPFGGRGTTIQLWI